MRPLARKDKLTIRELPGEMLVYDLERHALHCLNRTAALVWQHCDGRHDPAALAALVAQRLGLPAEQAEAAARLAQEQLGRRGLLQEAPTPAAEEERLTRRTALRKLAVAAAAALPLVMTLRSPSVAWAQGGISCQVDRPNSCPQGFHCLGTGRNHSGGHFKTGFCVPDTTTTTTTTTTKAPGSPSCAGKSAGASCGPPGSGCVCDSAGNCGGGIHCA
jgi:hypothetical protein